MELFQIFFCTTIYIVGATCCTPHAHKPLRFSVRIFWRRIASELTSRINQQDKHYLWRLKAFSTLERRENYICFIWSTWAQPYHLYNYFRVLWIQSRIFQTPWYFYTMVAQNRSGINSKFTTPLSKDQITDIPPHVRNCSLVTT